jgi:hypothetical protein
MHESTNIPASTVPDGIAPPATVATSTAAFRAARDRLIDLRENQAEAVAGFVWPDVGPTFNWARDWFDVIAAGNDRTALWIVEEDGSEQKISFADMAARSDRVATWLADTGVRRGDHVMLMLGNQVELWESMLAILKIGAVILPTTEMLGTADLADRVDRGGVAALLWAPARGMPRAGPTSPRAPPPWPVRSTGSARPTTRPSSTSPREPRANPRWCCTRRPRTRSVT